MSYKLISAGIYRDSDTGAFYERPWVRGRRTWRKLDGHTLKLAKEDFARRRTDQARAERGMARDPYAPPPSTVGAILEAYVSAGCPNRKHQPRTGKRLQAELHLINALTPFWKTRPADKIHVVQDCKAYFSHRRKSSIRKSDHGGRAVDLELCCLSNALEWARGVGRLEFNPLASGRPKFRPKTIRHCRETAPASPEELHALAAHFFEDPRSTVLGFQLLFEALSGCRTSEALALRWDAAPMQPGHIQGDHLWLARAKGGCNPFVLVHADLADLLAAMKSWAKSPWFFPSPRNDGPVDVGALSHALRRASQLAVGRAITSHGMRSYYVTVRRSQGASDAQIAAEIGDRTGPSIIASTYGEIPPNWQGRDALLWVPKGVDPAWRRFGGMSGGMSPETVLP